MKLIVGLGEPFDYGLMADSAQAPGSFRAFLAGPHASPAYVHHDGGQTAVEVEILPMWSIALLGVSAMDLGAQIVEVDQALGRSGHRLAEQIRSASAWSQRFEVIERFLSDRTQRTWAPSPEVVWAWEQIHLCAGNLSMSALAAELGWSERHLRRRFSAEAGLGLKTVARIARFERAERLRSQPSRQQAARVAATCGYFDQSHMIRERLALAGPPRVDSAS